jgi:hypothetical protein
LKAYVERLSLEQPFRADLDYYEGPCSRDRLGDGREHRRGKTRPRAAARVLELARAPPSRRGDGERRGTTDAVCARLPAIHLAAQSGQRDAVTALLELRADPLILDRLHGGNVLGWARVGGHEELADILP